MPGQHPGSYQCIFLQTEQAPQQREEKAITKEKFNRGTSTQDTTAGYDRAVKADTIIFISGSIRWEDP